MKNINNIVVYFGILSNALFICYMGYVEGQSTLAFNGTLAWVFLGFAYRENQTLKRTWIGETRGPVLYTKGKKR